MMKGIQRRKEIIHILSSAEKAISATFLAKQFSVSRQIIVGDIALLRAQGYEIIATARGYLFDSLKKEESILFTIACQHKAKEAEEEMLTIVSLGGELMDVTVEHPIYGELSGKLHIKNEKEVHAFIKICERNKALLLSSLTEGVHLHTIRCENQEIAEKIKKRLEKKQLLYND